MAFFFPLFSLSFSLSSHLIITTIVIYLDVVLQSTPTHVNKVAGYSEVAPLFWIGSYHKQEPNQTIKLPVSVSQEQKFTFPRQSDLGFFLPWFGLGLVHQSSRVLNKFP